MKPIVAAVAVMAMASFASPALAGVAQEASLTLPIAAADIRAALGVRTRAPAAEVIGEVARRHFHLPGLQDASQPGLARLAARLAAARDGGSGDVVPLPGGPAFWRDVTDVGDETLAHRLLLDRELSLFYVGMTSLEPGMLAHVVADRELARRLLRRHAAVFAAFGASLAVRNGRVAVPGGPGAEPLWTRLTGVAPASASRFVEAIVSADRGRLAYFYDTVASLDDARVAFVFGATAGREGRFPEIASVFETIEPAWRVDAQPFRRPAFDPALALRFARVTPAGVLDGPEPLDALAYLRRVFGMRAADRRVPGAAASARRAFDAIAAAQRLGTAAGEMRAARPSLAIALERMGVSGDAMFARVNRAAESLDARLLLRDELTAIWQGALMVLSAAARHGALDASGRDAALAALAGAAEARDPYAAVVDWFVERAPDGGPVEPALIAWAAGSLRPVRVIWEGEALMLDTARGRLASLTRVLDHPRRLTIDDIVVLRDVQQQVSSTRPLDVAAIAAQLAPLLPRYASAARVHAALAPGADAYARVAALDGAPASVPDAGRDARYLLGNELLAAWRAALADAMRVIVYAQAVHAGDAAATSVADFARRHRFAPPERVSLAPIGPWEPARVAAGAALLVEGSLLDLDLAVPEMSLRRVPGEMPAEPVMLAGERAALARNAVLAQDAPERSADAARPAGAPGTARLALTGCPCLGAPPPPAGWRDLAGRWDAGLLGAASPDLAIRLAALAEADGLPADLVRPLMLVATTDVIERADPAHPDDREAMARAAASIDAGRFEQYMLVLIAEGTLGPGGPVR